MKLYTNCKHYSKPTYKCKRPIGVSAITGDEILNNKYAEDERYYPFILDIIEHVCGKRGRFYVEATRSKTD